MGHDYVQTKVSLERLICREVHEVAEEVERVGEERSLGPRGALYGSPSGTEVRLSARCVGNRATVAHFSH